MNEPIGDTVFQADGLFSIAAPYGWVNAHDPDVPLLLANEACCGSGIFVDFASVEWHASEVKQRLIKSSETFLNDSVLRVEARDFKDVKNVVWGNKQCACIRLCAAFGGGVVWIVQFVHWAERSLVFILHWNGPEELADKINSMFDTFKVQGAAKRDGSKN